MRFVFDFELKAGFFFAVSFGVWLPRFSSYSLENSFFTNSFFGTIAALFCLKTSVGFFGFSLGGGLCGCYRRRRK